MPDSYTLKGLTSTYYPKTFPSAQPIHRSILINLKEKSQCGDKWLFNKIYLLSKL